MFRVIFFILKHMLWVEEKMTAIPVTELKQNFKLYADQVSDGEEIVIKRPGNKNNLVLLDQNEYEKLKHIWKYYEYIQELIVDKTETDTQIILTKRPKHMTLEERVEKYGSINNAGEHWSDIERIGREVW